MEKRYRCVRHPREVRVGLDEDPYNPLIQIAVWETGRGSKWLFRLKLVWQVVTTGNCYKDMVVLRPSEAKRLGRSLIHMSEVSEFRHETLTKNSGD